MRSFDAWGQLRNADWTVPGATAMLETARGFTGHEHLDNVGLIHMNGRVYDPKLGRMLSADPFVQAPAYTQSFNRYSYVFNNPLSFTDPSGFQADPDLENYRDTHGDSRPDPKDPRGDLGERNYDGGGASGGSDGTGSGIDMGGRGFVQTGTTLTDAYETREYYAGMGGELGNMAFDFIYMINITTNPYVFLAGMYLYPDPIFDTMGPDASTARQAGAWTAIVLSSVTPFGKRRAAQTGIEHGLGKLFGRQVVVSQKGLNIVENHLSGVLAAPQNAAMIARLRASLQKGQTVSGADASFYMHELAEATKMTKGGMTQAAAHEAALSKYGVSPFSVYHPDVIKALPDTFNNAWKGFWDIK